MKTVAGIDLGTQSMKVVIYDYEKKEIIEKASCPMDLISESDGKREQKAQWFDEGLEVCFGKLSAENKKTIEAMAKLCTTSNFGVTHLRLQSVKKLQKKQAETTQ